MKCKILHESPGRMRIRTLCGAMSLRQADILEAYLKKVDGAKSVKVYDRTGDAVICYAGSRDAMLHALAVFSYARSEELAPEHSSRALNREFEDKLVFTVLRRAGNQLFLPSPIRTAIAIFRSAKYIKAGLTSLLHGRLTVSVLDATAVTVSMVRGDFATAGSVMFMLRLGEILEEWTHKKSVADLAGAMSLNVDKVWLKADGTEILVPIGDVKAGDCIVVRTGGMIPLDGKVVDGEATVNQASITGESMPVPKGPGSYVYAGTVAEEGECVIQVEKAVGGGRYDRIVKMIEESEKLKSTAEGKASRLADRLVPYTLGGTALTYLLTRNAMKALAVLMVDFSCALKLSMPIAVLSAMRESSGYHISVKGGRFMEAVANADTVVFDKTGTLTYATPTVAKVVSFDGYSASEMLRLAACLEEHYPHSMANAVVEEARRLGLDHKEYHSQVEYVVAHGISSSVEDKKVIIGSAHFVFEDEGCVVPAGEEEKFNALPEEYSHLYLCIAGRLAAVICIADPLRKEAKSAIEALHACGISKVVMMTGDNRKTAQAVAREVGVDQFFAEVLPEDKANFVRQEKAAGRKVIMIGDGVNDTPALSEADVGIAINTGAAIAREIADVTIASEDLFELVTLRQLSQQLMRRIHRNYRFIVSFNCMLIALGVAGVIQPTTSALLHNASTLGISLDSMSDLLKKEQPSEKQDV
ncbi:MAG: heavy metal translocating P-type ATPase [Dysosmobacter sp.]|nr:heavy metal translocating P-type ATPase [Dysosmobacter sp.]MDY3866448.1 heavy metal translocating P-type ATPase [Dysosmobacter sp.]